MTLMALIPSELCPARVVLNALIASWNLYLFIKIIFVGDESSPFYDHTCA